MYGLFWELMHVVIVVSMYVWMDCVLWIYAWADDSSKLDHVGLPPTEVFYSTLQKEGSSDEEYQHALAVFKALLCVFFKDNHQEYLQTDVLLLADMREMFRSMCIYSYQLDPANSVSTPASSWHIMLLMASVQLDLITDLQILDMIEK